MLPFRLRLTYTILAILAAGTVVIYAATVHSVTPTDLLMNCVMLSSLPGDAYKTLFCVVIWSTAVIFGTQHRRAESISVPESYTEHLAARLVGVMLLAVLSVHGKANVPLVV